MLQTSIHTKMKNWFVSMIKEGRFTVDGKINTTPIFEILQKGDTITVYLYINDQTKGRFTNFQLIDQDGVVMDTEPDNLTKDENGGLLVVFRYSINKL